MYEHPIKRAGLTFNRILFSNTKMVSKCFPGVQGNKYDLQFTMKTYDNGKIVTHESKYIIQSWLCFCIVFTSKDLDNILPPTKAQEWKRLDLKKMKNLFKSIKIIKDVFY